MKRRIGNWQVERSLGEGGQGEVFLVRKLDWPRLGETLREMAENIQGVVHTHIHAEKLGDSLLEAYDIFARSELRALKRLKQYDSVEKGKKARERWKTEIKGLRKATHPALIRLFEVNEDEFWFVMEYHQRGILAKFQDQFRGDVKGSLESVRPVVEAVGALHNAGYIHRDIKPENVFVADDGRLVLGDLGLLFDVGADSTRVTDTYESVGSTPWMPTWAHGMRVEDVPKSFDVFTLGKLIWWMISGKSFLRFHYFRDEEFDLERIFPNDATMSRVNDLLSKCITERKDEGVQDANELLHEIDQTLSFLQPRASLRPIDLFPGKWSLTWRTPEGKGAKETFELDDDGIYSINGKPVFITRIIASLDEDSIVFQKKIIGGTVHSRELLKIVGEEKRIGTDDLQNKLEYRRVHVVDP